MSNLDNLVAEILQQAKKEANRILTKAKAENLEFTEKENKKIQREVDILEQKSKEEAVSLKERILSNANLKSRDMILQAKEELVDKVLEKALERLKNIDKDSYLDFIENTLKSLNISSSSLLPHEVLTMASIIEKEGKSYEDRQKMVDLFNRRIASNTSLGSDVTSYYGLGIKLNERELTKAEYNAKNKYNTRVIKGLPIGPICMPSKSSIKAVLNPIKHDNLYFVSDKYGKIYFSKTQAEQDRVIASLKKEGKWFIHDNK